MRKILLLILFIPVLAFAAEYRLEDLIETGLKKSVEIQTVKMDLENSQSSLRSNWYDVLPTDMISAGKDKKKSNIGWSEWDSDAGFQISETLFLDDSRYFNISRAYLEKNNAELELNNTRKQVVYNIFAKYTAVLEGQKKLEIQTKNLELQQKIYNQTQVQFRSGEKSALDLKQAEIDRINYEIAVNEAENDLSKKRQNLFNYLNIKDEGYALQEPELELKQEAAEYRENFRLHQIKNNVKINKSLLCQEKMNFLPTLSLGYSYNYIKEEDAGLVDFDQYDDYQTIFISAQYSLIDLLNKGESHYRARRNLRQQELNLDESRKNLKSEVSNLNKDIQTMQKSYDLYVKRLKLAEENLQMAQEQFRLGLINLLDLDRSKIEYQNAQLSYISSHYNLMRKQEELNLLLSGKILAKW